jgi:hypothetical protein
VSRAFKIVLTVVLTLVISLGGTVWLIGFTLVSDEVDRQRPTWVTPSPSPSPSASRR